MSAVSTDRYRRYDALETLSELAIRSHAPGVQSAVAAAAVVFFVR